MKKHQKEPNNVEEVKEEPEELTLPQNILLIGEQETENKKIYILQKTYKEIHKFTKDKTKNESGGVLLGYVLEEFGKENIVINGFVEAKHCEATPTTLTFTHQTWDYIHSEVDKKYPNAKILGWIHTHPDYGIFLSEYDKFIQENFFSGENQIAYVVDPIQNIEGFYYWINEKIERCKGFYIYDKTGTKIEIETVVENDKEQEVIPEHESGKLELLVKVLLAAVLVVLAISNVKLNCRISALESRVSEYSNRVANMEYNYEYIFDAIMTMQNQSSENNSETKENEEEALGSGEESNFQNGAPEQTSENIDDEQTEKGVV